MRAFKALVLAIFASFVLASSAAAVEATYACGDGTGITADFSPPDQTPGNVSLSLDGSPDLIELPQVLSADGGRYEKDGIEFWIKGRDATLTRDGKSVICKGAQ